MLLHKKLAKAFPDDHGYYLYRAPLSPADPPPSRDPLELSGLVGKSIDPGFILYIPAMAEPEIDQAFAKRVKKRRPQG